jgi:hypothetical protein
MKIELEAQPRRSASMKYAKVTLLGFALVLAGAAAALAQEQAPATTPPPKVLVITREFVKPGKAGAIHEKMESAFVQAMTRANWPTHYLAMTSLSGAPRALFFVGYDSFAAWEKDNEATAKNATLAAALDRAAMADGELLSSMDLGVFVYNPEASLRAPVDIAHMRYFEITAFHPRIGHRKEWDELVKLYLHGFEKIAGGHWATYESAYGSSGDTVLVITPMKSASEIDQEFAQGKEFEEAMGKDGMKKVHELEAASIESTQSNLFLFNPAMSNVAEEWVKADPDFWKHKTAASGMPKKSAEKKTEKP